MLVNLGVSALFLVLYVTQIATVGHKRFPGDDWVRTVFLGILLSHTILAVCLVPLVLRTVFLAFRARFADIAELPESPFPSGCMSP